MFKKIMLSVMALGSFAMGAQAIEFNDRILLEDTNGTTTILKWIQQFRATPVESGVDIRGIFAVTVDSEDNLLDNVYIAKNTGKHAAYLMSEVVVNLDGSSETTYEYIGEGVASARTLIRDTSGTPVQFLRVGNNKLYDIVDYVN